MSNWTDLAAGVNDIFTDTFGEDESIYSPANGPSDYPITFVNGSPNAVENTTSSFLQLWAPRSSFQADPVPGDIVTLGNGNRYIVFKAHPDRLDDDSAGIWLSLNAE